MVDIITTLILYLIGWNRRNKDVLVFSCSTTNYHQHPVSGQFPWVRSPGTHSLTESQLRVLLAVTDLLVGLCCDPEAHCGRIHFHALSGCWSNFSPRGFMTETLGFSLAALRSWITVAPWHLAFSVAFHCRLFASSKPSGKALSSLSHNLK